MVGGEGRGREGGEGRGEREERGREGQSPRAKILATALITEQQHLICSATFVLGVIHKGCPHGGGVLGVIHKGCPHGGGKEG